MRCFLALELDEAAREKLAGIQEELKSLGIRASYPQESQLHCTLCFFGELGEDEVKRKMEKLGTFQAKQFNCTLKGIGFFPSASHARVVWAGFEEGKEELIQLQGNISRLLNYHDGKPFHPHVTLARVKTTKNTGTLPEFAQKHAETLATFRASTIRLYKSTLSPEGPKYEVLFEKVLS
ncbi:RNA 2',3'-cyclic phosphodiesterase [Candidatus Micrarchaeota archaeon]|nr:RNA 2',3'-cyclic phosphodiesterase [Candidatus Micrarchaeota archaeon]